MTARFSAWYSRRRHESSGGGSSRIAAARGCRVVAAWIVVAGGLGGTGPVGAETIRLEFLAAGQASPAAETDASATASEPAVSSEDQFLILGLPKATRDAVARQSWDAARWQQVFRVQADGVDASLPPLLGRHELTAGGARFVPRFPLRPGRRYRVTLDLACLPALPDDRSELLEKLITTAESPAANQGEQPEPRLTTIHPSGSVLPENQLKFYLHFSAPMRRGDSYRHIRLWVAPREESELSATADAAVPGPSWTEVEHPFLELPEELWDPEYQRFTLFFDPGRIKRGLKPREEFGPALEEGRRYVLEIDRQWRGGEGRPLAETARKEFRIVAPDDAQPRAEDWRVIAPRGQRSWLRLEFDEPLDQAMLERVLHVEKASGERLLGEVVIDREESRWSFRPEKPWQPGEHAVVVGTHLEDRAGNSLAKPFEVDLFEKVERQVETRTIRLPFRVEAN